MIPARPFPDWVTVARGSAWVANVEGGIGRYDAGTGELLGVAGRGLDVCTAMAVGSGSLWAADCAHDRLVRIDLASGDVTATVVTPAGVHPEGGVASGPTGTYVVAADGA